MSRIDTLAHGAFRDDRRLHDELRALAAPSYENEQAVLTRELAHCDTLYTVRDEDDRLICFYLTALETLTLSDGRGLPALYLGLSATREDTKDTGQIALLYERSICDALKWEAIHRQSLLLWATTATPVPYLGASLYLRHAEPLRDGSYSEQGAIFARAIREQFYRDIPKDGHPFVIKGVASDTRYSAAERSHIERLCRTKRFGLFDDLGVDESRGDRLLFIARTPIDEQALV